MKNRKIVVTSAIASMVAIIVYFFIKTPTGHKGFYDNKQSSVIGIISAEDKQITWHKKNGDNGVDLYGVDGMISSTYNWPKIAAYVKKLKRNGIPNVGFIYSNSVSVTNYLDKYQKAQASDSTRFTRVVSELEPYLSGGNVDYPTFYRYIREASVWALRQSPRMERVVYQGWLSQAADDSVVKYTDRSFVHCYISSTNMLSASYIYNYQASRLGKLASSMDRLYPAGVKYNVVTIYSVEPDFAFNYFQSHSWEQPQALMASYFSTYASSQIKNRITLGGRQIFVSYFGLQARP